MIPLAKRERFESMVAKLAYDFRSLTESDTLHKAILAAYDAVCVPVTWTSKQPEKAGWYWWRGRPDVKPDIHYVSEQDIEEGNPPGQWAGPITEPEESLK